MIHRIPLILPLLMAIAITLFFACSEKNEPVTRAADYEAFLQPRPALKILETTDAEIGFWSQRLEHHPEDIVSQTKLAGLHSRRFSHSGDIHDMEVSDSLYHAVNRIQRKFTGNVYRSLAQNAITRHRFREAASFIDSALLMGDQKYLSTLVAFDVALELGDYMKAKLILDELPEKTGFDYLIRAGKVKDLEGDLNGAIRLMEQALTEARRFENETLVQWATSNLGDMYSHANRYKDAYKNYLAVLKKDPGYFHALKGIAWLAWSHDQNTTEANRILQYLTGCHPVPDYHLILAEIAAAENDKSGQQQHLGQFLTVTRDKRYGDMYNKYLFDIYADKRGDAATALRIAQTEIANRPTPVSYHLLAYAFLINGEAVKALSIAKEHVENKTFEPGVLLRLGKIYAANGLQPQAKRYFREARESAFELGPMAEAGE